MLIVLFVLSTFCNKYLLLICFFYRTAAYVSLLESWMFHLSFKCKLFDSILWGPPVVPSPSCQPTFIQTISTDGFYVLLFT